MSLLHEFLQIAPERAALLREDELAVPYDEVHAPPAGMRVFRLHDDVIRRNLGHVDGRMSDDWTGMATYEPGRMRFFSGFTGVTGGIQHAGLNSYGVTLLDAAALAYLTAPVDAVGAIAPGDKLSISRFRRFCEETRDAGLCLVHFGI